MAGRPSFAQKKRRRFSCWCYLNTYLTFVAFKSNAFRYFGWFYVQTTIAQNFAIVKLIFYSNCLFRKGGDKNTTVIGYQRPCLSIFWHVILIFECQEFIPTKITSLNRDFWQLSWLSYLGAVCPDLPHGEVTLASALPHVTSGWGNMWGLQCKLPWCWISYMHQPAELLLGINNEKN